MKKTKKTLIYRSQISVSAFIIGSYIILSLVAAPPARAFGSPEVRILSPWPAPSLTLAPPGPHPFFETAKSRITRHLLQVINEADPSPPVQACAAKSRIARYLQHVINGTGSSPSVRALAAKGRLLQHLRRLIGSAGFSPPVQARAAKTRLTKPLRQVQHSWTRPGPANEILFYLLIATIVVFALWLLVRAWRLSRQSPPGPRNDPERLFADLMAQLDLSASDRKILRQVVEKTRLKNPAVCLLSPDLLIRAARLSLQDEPEKPLPRQLGPVPKQLEKISVALYDHTVPASPPERKARS